MAPERPRVRLVVLNYNGGDHLGHCLSALAALDWPADRLDLVVVDNASTDGSDELAAQQPRVRLIRNGANTGFPANNLALRDLDGIDYVGLVNADSFVEPGWLAPLVGALEADAGLGAVSARLLFADRFVDVEITSPTFVPGGGDERTLGVSVGGLRVDGIDRWRDAQLPEGTWGIEHRPDGSTFQWTRGRAILRVPAGVAGAGGGPPEVTGVLAEIELSAEAPKRVTLRSGDHERVVEVGTRPQWVEVKLGGPARDIVNNVGSVLVEGGYGADRGFLEPDEGQYDAPAEVFAWCGASVLLRPDYLRDVGLFDERFFLYYEDTDLSWRGRSRGWRYRYVPEAVVRHIHAASTGEGSPTFQHYVERNRLVMLVKNAPAGFAARAVGRYVLATLSYGRRDVAVPLLRLRRPNLLSVRRRVGSLGGLVRLLPHALWARRQIRTMATVPADELMGWAVRR